MATKDWRAEEAAARKHREQLVSEEIMALAMQDPSVRAAVVNYTYGNVSYTGMLEQLVLILAMEKENALEAHRKDMERDFRPLMV